ncbi:MAG: hypothetical protein ABIZ70_09450 [Gemmatimonadales bacterium]
MRLLLRLLGIGILAATGSLRAQVVNIPLAPAQWQATDSIRFDQWQGRPALWINKGLAFARDVHATNGTFEVDIWTGASAQNIGITFHSRDRNASEVIFVRPGLSGTPESIQYGPALNGTGVAWQIYHGDGANAATNISHDAWVHLEVRVAGDTARLYLDHATEPTLVVPHLVLGPDAGGSIGVWTGAFGRGAWFSNVRYTPDPTPHAIAQLELPTGTIADWEISQAFEAATQVPGKLPAATSLKWEKVRAEFPGLVLLNRYRVASARGAPGAFPDSILAGRVAGSRVVYARTVITAAKAGLRRIHIGFSDAAILYGNGVPLFAGFRPAYLNDLGYMNLLGDAVYLPLKAGRNEIVLAVTEYFGGWAFSARLDP